MSTNSNINLTQIGSDLGFAITLSAVSSGAMLKGLQVAADFASVPAAIILIVTGLIAAGLFAMAGPFYGRAGAEFFRHFPKWTGFVFGLFIALAMTGSWYYATKQAEVAIQDARQPTRE